MRIHSATSTSILGSLLLFVIGSRLPLSHGKQNEIDSVIGKRIIATTRSLQSTACSFNDLFASLCSMQDYCSTLTTTPGMTATCSGLITGEWTIAIQLDELCYPSETREDSFARNAADAELSYAFCSIESATFSFRGFVLEQSQHQEIVTYPSQAKGLVQQTTYYTACDDSVADTYFGRGYCASPCPETKLQGSLVCGEQCQVCSDGKQVLDCSNMDATLVEDCDDESAFIRALLAYLKAETSASLSSEPFNNNNSTNGGDDLETTDTGGDSESEIDELPTEDGTASREQRDTENSNDPTTGLNSSAVFLINSVRNLAMLLTIAMVAQ